MKKQDAIVVLQESAPRLHAIVEAGSEPTCTLARCILALAALQPIDVPAIFTAKHEEG